MLILPKRTVTPTTPATDKITLYANSNEELAFVNDAGTARALPIITTGSWTPDLHFGSGKTGITYSSRSGSYRILTTGSSQLIVAHFFFLLTSKGSSTGSAAIRGIPEGATPSSGAAAIRYIQNLTSLTGLLVAYPNDNNGGEVQFYQTSAGNLAALTDANFQNTSRIDGVYTSII